MRSYHIMRTYLVRYRTSVTARDEEQALKIHREALEKRTGSCEAGSLEVLDENMEWAQLDALGSSYDQLADLCVDDLYKKDGE